MPSWDDLIKDISNEQVDNSIPNTLKYEAIILKEPYRQPDLQLVSNDGYQLIDKDGNLLYISGQLTEKVLKERIAGRLKTFPSNKVYERIAQLPFSHYITTNYDNTLFKSLGDGIIDSKYRIEKLYSIRRHYKFDSGNEDIHCYWPIHGNIESPASIMLGFDHYCGSLAKIENYIKGNYVAPDGRIDSMTKRLQQGVMNITSWIDLFFISDVHIIGLNLGYEETDLWWVLNKRCRIKQAQPDLIRNTISFYPVDTLSGDKEQLLSSFGVIIEELDDKYKRIKSSYEMRYLKQLEIIENKVKLTSLLK